MKFLNRHPFIKRLLFGLANSLVITALLGIFFNFAIPPRPVNESRIGAGDTIVITGPEYIDISVFAEDVTAQTSILSGDTIIINTVPGAKSGYYDFVGTIQPGVYQVSGASAYLVLQKDAQVANDDMDKRTIDVNKQMFIFIFIFIFLLYFAAARRLINLEVKNE